jgi:hypothetical protein
MNQSESAIRKNKDHRHLQNKRDIQHPPRLEVQTVLQAILREICLYLTESRDKPREDVEWPGAVIRYL